MEDEAALGAASDSIECYLIVFEAETESPTKLQAQTVLLALGDEVSETASKLERSAVL